MSDPLVTVVTPSLNQAQFLRATIESVLRQNYPKIEYIVMDGGSTDVSAAIAAEYSSRLMWVSEPDRGQSHAINKGFRMANGEILAWLNSDDVLLDGAVSNAVAGFRQNSHAGAVYGEGYLMDRDGNLSCRFPHTQPFNLWRLTYLSDYILQQSAFFRGDVVRELGYLREDLHYTMDWDLLIRIARQYPLHYIPEYLGCLREHGEAKTATGGRTRIREIRNLLREHTGRLIPPGWVVYGLETYGNFWCQRIARHTPAWIEQAGEFLQLLVTFGFGYLVERALHDAQGWYTDGWASSRLRWMLPAPSGNLIIEGTLPPNEWLRGQAIEVFFNGDSLGSFRIPFGDFRLELSAGRFVPSGPANLELVATHSFVPAYSTNSTDFRKLSYLVRHIGWSDWSAARPASFVRPARFAEQAAVHP